MPFVEYNGLTFHQVLLGDAGGSVCMVHGLLVGSLATWYFGVAPRLARTHRVLLYDLRGHGKSQRTKAGYDLDTMADDLEAQLDGAATMGPPWTLVGHSYGALTALRFTLRRPERVARLVLIDAPLPPWRIADWRWLAQEGSDAMLRVLPKVLGGALERGGRAAQRFRAQLEFLAIESTLLTDLAGEDAFDLDGSRGAAFRAALEALRVKVLCLYGEDSICRAGGERMARAIPGAEFRVLPGGHFLPIEAPSALADELERFCHG